MEKSDNIKYVEEVLEKVLQFAGEHGGATKRGKQALREAEEKKQKTIYDDHFEADHEASLEENHADWLDAVKDAGLPHPKDPEKQKRIVSHMINRAKSKSMGKSEVVKFEANGQWSLEKVYNPPKTYNWKAPSGTNLHEGVHPVPARVKKT